MFLVVEYGSKSTFDFAWIGGYQEADEIINKFDNYWIDRSKFDFSVPQLVKEPKIETPKNQNKGAKRTLTSINKKIKDSMKDPKTFIKNMLDKLKLSQGRKKRAAKEDSLKQYCFKLKFGKDNNWITAECFEQHPYICKKDVNKADEKYKCKEGWNYWEQTKTCYKVKTFMFLTSFRSVKTKKRS